MERLCFTFEIRPGTEDEYKRRHDEIWPELVEAIKTAGMANYSLFRRGTTIVGYAECEESVAASFTKLGPLDVTRRWAEWFREIIVSLTDESGNLYRLDEVWHLA